MSHNKYFGLYVLICGIVKHFFFILPQMWKRKAKKAAGKGSTLIKTGKVPALAAAKQQAQAQPVPIRHGGHHPSAQKASAAITAAMLTKAAKQAVEEIPAKVGFLYYTQAFKRALLFLFSIITAKLAFTWTVFDLYFRYQSCSNLLFCYPLMYV